LGRAIETDWVLPNWSIRNWTRIGNLASPWQAIVDPRGLVTPWLDGWSLDWWIGAEDGWHVPSREAPSRVRQRLIAAAPVVETELRVPGGHAVHRAYACYTGLAGDEESEMVVVEIENRSPVPFAVALAVRPYNPQGLAVIERIGLHDGTTVTVDGRTAMLLPRPPAQVAASTSSDGDSARVVLADGARTGGIPPGLRDKAGMAQAAFVHPLPHTAVLRAVLPLVPSKSRATTFPTAIPSAEQVARGWAAQSRGGMRLVLPDPRLQEAVDANLRFFLALHGYMFGSSDRDDVGAGAEFARSDRSALDRLSWLLDVATPTWTWQGHDGREVAGFLSLVRNLLVRELPAGDDDGVPGLAVCSLLPDSWLGQGFEVHDAPTQVGSMSYAVRWHGARPALLWELAPHDGIDTVRLTAPGLDPGWSTVERTGEVLLSVPERGALSG